MKFVLIGLLALSFACQKKNDSAEAALKNFVDMHVGKIVKKEDMVKFVTGKLQAQLESLSPEEFGQVVDLTNIKKGSLKIITESCTEDKCTMTYTINYFTMESDKKVFDTEVKKIAEIEKVGDEWLISDVSNVKTYHDSLEPINTLE